MDERIVDKVVEDLLKERIGIDLDPGKIEIEIDM